MQTSHAVLLTPVGRGAVATVLAEGEGVVNAVERWFVPAAGVSLADIPLGQIAFGSWRTADDPGEELVVCRRSRTQIEIHCHGGLAAAESILALLAAVGFSTEPWQDWARRVEPDPFAAEARLALAAARTERAARVLLDQYQGALRAAITRAAAFCQAGDLKQSVVELDAMLRFENVGRHLATPFRVVLAGPPNVGKSSLINALLGFERSIVFDQPGTTRDVLTAQTAFDGWPVELTDTAGLRLAEGNIEAQGVARAREQTSQADLVLLVFDISRGWSMADQDLADSMPDALLVLNKCDLLEADFTRQSNAYYTSATTGAGIDELTQTISRRLVPNPPPPGAAVPFTTEHVALLRAVRERATSGDAAAAVQILLALNSRKE